MGYWRYKSDLATTEIITTNRNERTGERLRFLTPHCVVGQLPASSVANMTKFKPGGAASANYIIGKSGEILLNVPEMYRAWTSGGAKNISGMTGKKNDYEAITIECASDINKPYTFNTDVYNSLVNLSVDICKAYGKKRLIYIADATAAIARPYNSEELLVSCHCWYAFTACPGDWFLDKLPYFAEEVTSKLSEQKEEEPTDGTGLFHVQVGAFKNRSNAVNLAESLKRDGYDTYIVRY